MDLVLTRHKTVL